MIGRKNHPERTRDALTPTMKKKIKTLFGKCEHCNEKKPINLLEVHHIVKVATANGTSDKNTPGNLIVMCLEHHKLAEDGKITKKTLKSKIAKRSEKRKTELKAILRHREKITDTPLLPPIPKPPVYKPPVYKPPKFKLPKF